MSLRTLSADDELGLARGAVAVVIAWSSDELAPRTLQSVAAHTADDVPIIVLACGDDAEAVAATAEGREILLVAAAAQEAVARAAGVTGKADLLWLAAGVRVGSEYLARLQGAATSDSTVISASAMVGAEDTGATIDERARAVAAVASRAYPRVSQLDPRCVLIRRAGLDRAALGGRDPAGSLREL